MNTAAFFITRNTNLTAGVRASSIGAFSEDLDEPKDGTFPIVEEYGGIVAGSPGLHLHIGKRSRMLIAF